MSRAPVASGRGRDALGVVLGVVLTLLVPALVGADATMPAAAAMVLVLAALLLGAPRSSSWAAGLCSAPSMTGDAPPLVLPGGVTDPVHHPLRPRAPGHA